MYMVPQRRDLRNAGNSVSRLLGIRQCGDVAPMPPTTRGGEGNIIEEGEETQSQYFHTEICMYSFQVGGYGVRLKLFMTWHWRPSGGKTAEYEI